MTAAFLVVASVVFLAEVAAVVVLSSLSSDGGVNSGSLSDSVPLVLSDGAMVETSVVSELKDVSLTVFVTDVSGAALQEAMTERRHISADIAAGLITDLLMLLLFVLKVFSVHTNKTIIPSLKKRGLETF